MTNLGPEAQELLTGQPAPAGAAPTKSSEGAAPGQTGQPDMVPRTSLIEAVKGEAENTRKAREAMDRARAEAQQYGFHIADDGSLIPPARPTYQAQASPQTDPEFMAMAQETGLPVEVLERLGNVIERKALQRMGVAANELISPIAAGNAEILKSHYRKADPVFDASWDLFAQDIDKHLNYLDPASRAAPQAVQLAIRMAVGDHLHEIIEREVERRGGNPRVVGQVMEGVRSGGDGAPASGLPIDPSVFSGKTPEEVQRLHARALANRQQRLAGEGR